MDTTNTFKGETTPETREGLVGDAMPELRLDMPDEDILKLTGRWKSLWDDSDIKKVFTAAGEENEKYWKGQHYEATRSDGTRANVDNVIFEALETYLPQATRRNPEPTVELMSTETVDEKSEAFAKGMQARLAEIADVIKLRLKLKTVTRHWAIFLLGAGKPAWDGDRDMPTLSVIRPQKLILDPDAPTDEEGYRGEWFGEYRKETASFVKSVLRDAGQDGAIAKIDEITKGDDGSEVRFIEWWTKEYLCWTLDDAVLLKRKYPHWNYETEEEKDLPYDDQGEPTGTELVKVPATNHFSSPRLPLIPLSVYSLGRRPVDETSLIGQNLANQDRLNKRNRQTDRNIDSMNNGLVVSLGRSGLNDAQARDVANSLRKGDVVAIPDGSPSDAVARMAASSLPSDVYNDVADVRNRIQDVFGTRGSSAGGIESESTVRGKIISRGLDTDRIGGGVSEYLEQFSDDVFNWFVQLLYVYDDALSQVKTPPRLIVSVKEGSMLPKDSVTEANQAIVLASQGKMSTLDLYKALDKPNAEELAANVWLEANAPQVLFANDPRVAEALAAMGQGPKPPSASLSYKDLPPDGQAQLAAQAGVQLHPEAIAAYNEQKDAKAAEQKQVEAQFNAALKPNPNDDAKKQP